MAPPGIRASSDHIRARKNIPCPRLVPGSTSLLEARPGSHFQPISLLGGAAEQRSLLVGRIPGGDPLERVPQHLVAAGAFVDRKLLSNIDRPGPNAATQASM